MMSNDQMLPKIKLVQTRGEGGKRRGLSINQSINQLYLNTVNGSASWFSDRRGGRWGGGGGSGGQKGVVVYRTFTLSPKNIIAHENCTPPLARIIF